MKNSKETGIGTIIGPKILSETGKRVSAVLPYVYESSEEFRQPIKCIINPVVKFFVDLMETQNNVVSKNFLN